MLLKSLALASVLAVLCHAQPTNVKILPFVDSSLPIKFREIIAEAAPKVPSNLASYAFAIDLSVPVSTSQLQCIKQAGYSVAFVRAYNPAGQGSFDANACTTIQNAYYAGLGTEVYMTPQPASAKQGYQQLDEIYQGFTARGITIRAIWIQVTSPTNWPSNANTNVNFINSILSRARQYGMTVGIYTSYYDWNQITNGWSSVGSDVLLWYWNVLGGGVNGETPATFTDFRPFGCWSVPSVKQFAQVEQVCQITVNRDVYAAGSMLKASDAVEDGKIYAGGFVTGNQ
uniref:Lysozyme n=1 Tax=Caenorhabditis japonica TaxID=281687 RepID=A0A8R1HKB6_CAEJA